MSANKGTGLEQPVISVHSPEIMPAPRMPRQKPKSIASRSSQVGCRSQPSSQACWVTKRGTGLEQPVICWQLPPILPQPRILRHIPKSTPERSSHASVWARPDVGRSTARQASNTTGFINTGITNPWCRRLEIRNMKAVHGKNTPACHPPFTPTRLIIRRKHHDYLMYLHVFAGIRCDCSRLPVRRGQMNLVEQYTRQK